MAKQRAGKRIVKRVRAEAEQQQQSNIAVNPFSYSFRKISKIAVVPPTTLFEIRKPELRLALVSLPKITSLRKKELTTACSKSVQVDHESCKRVLIGHANADEYLRLFKSALRTATKRHKADIICFNELAFPQNAALGPNVKAADFCRKMAADHKLLIVAGSMHDSRTLYNTTFVFYPGCDRFGYQYHKQISASQLKPPELVSVPSRRESVYLRAFGLEISILVCIDLLDYSSVAPVVRSETDLLLAPCYSDWLEPLERVAIATSRGMPGAVALVNRHQPVKPGSVLYRFGNSEPVEGSVESIGAKGGSLSGSVVVHTIDVEDFKSEKYRLNIAPHASTVSLFGQKTVIR